MEQNGSFLVLFCFKCRNKRHKPCFSDCVFNYIYYIFVLPVTWKENICFEPVQVSIWSETRTFQNFFCFLLLFSVLSRHASSFLNLSHATVTQLAGNKHTRPGMTRTGTSNGLQQHSGECKTEKGPWCLQVSGNCQRGKGWTQLQKLHTFEIHLWLLMQTMKSPFRIYSRKFLTCLFIIIKTWWFPEFWFQTITIIYLFQPNHTETCKNGKDLNVVEQRDGFPTLPSACSVSHGPWMQHRVHTEARLHHRVHRPTNTTRVMVTF